MAFAADAVADMIAPPPKPVATKAADTSGPSFDDHLDAARDAESARQSQDASDARDAARADAADAADDRADARADTTDSTDAAANTKSEEPTKETAQLATEHTAEKPSGEAKSAPPTPAPLVVQLIAAAQEQTQTAKATVETAQPTAPPPETTVAVVQTQTPATTNTNGKKANARDGHAKTLPTESKAAESQAVATPDAIAAPATTSPQTVQAPQQKAQTGDSETPAISAPQSTPARTPDTRNAKADADTGVKPASQQAASTPLAAASPADSKSQASKPTSARANAAAAIAAATPSDSAPQSAQAPAPLAAAAQVQTPPQTQHVAPDESGLRVAPAASQVAHEIVRRFDGETTRFAIRLDPPELGRVEVRLEVSRDHRVTATVSADSPQALNELTRHARDLEQTLQSAGLELADNGLSFDLRQGGEGRQQANDASSAAPMTGDETQPEQQTAAVRPRLESWRGVRLDMMV